MLGRNTMAIPKHDDLILRSFQAALEAHACMHSNTGTRAEDGASNHEAGLSGCSRPDAGKQQQHGGSTDPVGPSRPARRFQHHAYQQAKQRQQEVAEAQHQAQQQASTSEADAGSGGGAAQQTQQTQQPQGQQGADGYTASYADPSAPAGSAEYWQEWLASPDSAAYWRHYGHTHPPQTPAWWPPPPPPPPPPSFWWNAQHHADPLQRPDSGRAAHEPAASLHQQAAAGPPHDRALLAAISQAAEELGNPDLEHVLLAWWDAGYTACWQQQTADEGDALQPGAENELSS